MGAREAYNCLMNRPVRIVVAALALLLIVVASALAAPSDRGRDQMAPLAASHQPESPGNQGDDPDELTEEDSDGPPSADALARLVDRLAEAGIATDADTIAALAADYGVGGAIRLLAWADASGLSTGDLAARFDGGQGWGEIARELDLHPGIGSIMGNGGGGPPDHAQGLGREGAPGQQDN
jgi:hypothetical protein